MALTRLLTSSASARPSLRKIALMCFSTARLVRNSDSAIAVLLLPCAISREHLALARGQLVERRALGSGRARDERLDDLRVDHRAAVGDGADRRHQLGAVVHALLEQVGAAVGAALEQRERVDRVGELAEDHDADLRVAVAQLGRRAGCPRRCASAASGCR